MKCGYEWVRVGTGGWAGVRHVITQFSLMDSLPNVITHGSPLRAPESSAKKDTFRLMSALYWSYISPCILDGKIRNTCFSRQEALTDGKNVM